MPKPVRVMLADDHESIRQGLRAVVPAVPAIEVVGDAGDADALLASVRREKPDVLVLDLSMPNVGGMASIRRIREAMPRLAVVVLTRSGDRVFVDDVFAAGGSGYVLKQSPFSELHRAIAAAAAGQHYVDSRLAPTDDRPVVTEGAISGREREVLRRTALGHSNKEIAAALAIAVKTVEVHKSHGMRKLGLQDRTELVRYAAMQGWLLEP
jgi:DNA-binding NarL/FixJ family response regulator